MKTIKVNSWHEIPVKFTGIAEWSDGSKEYFKNGKYHRENGLPAIESENGEKYYCVEGKIHRITGPAYENVNGTKEYWIYGKHISKEAHDLLVDIIKMKEISL